MHHYSVLLVSGILLKEIFTCWGDSEQIYSHVIIAEGEINT